MAFFAAFAFVIVLVIDPYSGAYADGLSAPNQWQARDQNGQSFVVAGDFSTKITHDVYSVQVPVAPKVATAGRAPVAGVPDPGTAQAIALAILQARGMGMDQYS